MFSISDFVRVNRVYLIWVIFAALLYLFRDMFGLVFITYIMCFITSSITHALRRRFRWRTMYACNTVPSEKIINSPFLMNRGTKR